MLSVLSNATLLLNTSSKRMNEASLKSSYNSMKAIFFPVFVVIALADLMMPAVKNEPVLLGISDKGETFAALSLFSMKARNLKSSKSSVRLSFLMLKKAVQMSSSSLMTSSKVAGCFFSY